jgi:hypothetical protein
VQNVAIRKRVGFTAVSKISFKYLSFIFGKSAKINADTTENQVVEEKGKYKE